MPLICKFLLESIFIISKLFILILCGLEFGLRITLFVLAGLVLICAVCGILYKSLPVPEDKICLNEELKQQALLAALSRADFTENKENSNDNELVIF